MTFEQWWKEHYQHGSDVFNIYTEKAFRASWDAATKAERERCAKVADDYSSGFEAVRAAEGASWCPKCGEYTKDVADDIGRRIREVPK